MKKLIIMLMCLLLAASFAACGKTDSQPASSGSDAGSAVETDGSDVLSVDEPAQIANPFKDCASLDEAEQVAGFEITAPEEVSGLENTVVQAVDDDMIQVYYCHDPENVQEGDYALFRKAAGEEDISGDYSKYAYEKEVDVDGLTVTFKGYEGNNLAVWNDGEYSYSIYSTEELSDEAMANLVRTLK
jgi:hypothetical protein